MYVYFVDFIDECEGTLCTTCAITVAINLLMYSIQGFSQQMFKGDEYSYFNDEVLRLRGFFMTFATILKHFKPKTRGGGAIKKRGRATI